MIFERKIIFYLAGCTVFPHPPAPIWQLYYLRPPVAPCHPSLRPLIPFPPISPLISSAQVSLGLPSFLLPGWLHFVTSFGNLPSSILWTCPYRWTSLVLISSKRDLVTFTFCLIMVLLTLSFLGNSSRSSPKVHFCGILFWYSFCFKTPCYCCMCNCTFNHTVPAYVIVY